MGLLGWGSLCFRSLALLCPLNNPFPSFSLLLVLPLHPTLGETLASSEHLCSCRAAHSGAAESGSAGAAEAVFAAVPATGAGV